MSRTILLAVFVAAIGAGIYYYLNQPEPTPAEQLQSAAQDAGDAVNEAVDAATEQVNEAASSVADQASQAAEQAGQAATDLANQAGDQVASLAGQGQDLVNTWIEQGSLNVQNFDYDAMVASVQNSDLAQDLKDQAIKILDEIKASPQLIGEKIEELRTLLSGQQ
ncbi:hypothetical protein [Ruegeria sp. Ofav3-42]|uniref:hypothetical protein n=1 Tax=Ruegeria sp. Ofav3-42 TaxID=2917759 RepID=UPI001EF5C707|nr:hypothetical protein [Ruegeria sp. Ofav3-42]MCG7518332.1 hypothetical protein [Ruegeria sp. Ofav3-42]